MMATDELKGFRLFRIPICFKCVHLGHVKGHMTCTAYPDEIPDKIVFGPSTAHDTVQDDQVGTDVFMEYLRVSNKRRMIYRERDPEDYE
jgi:hypothetical protein